MILRARMRGHTRVHIYNYISFIIIFSLFHICDLALFCSESTWIWLYESLRSCWECYDIINPEWPGRIKYSCWGHGLLLATFQQLWFPSRQIFLMIAARQSALMHKDVCRKCMKLRHNLSIFWKRSTFISFIHQPIYLQ